MASPKIVVVTPEFPTADEPYRGRPVYQMLACLQQYAEVKVVCPLARYPDWFRPIHFDYQKPRIADWTSTVSAQYFAYPAIPGLTRPFNGIACAHYLAPFIAKSRPSVILNYWLYPAGYAAVAVGRKLGIPVIVGSIGSDLNSIADPVTRWLTRRTLRRASFVITKSEQLRSHAVAMGVDPKRVQTIVNGCNTEIFCPRDRNAARTELGVEPDSELVAFVGRMENGKGIRELFEAVGVLSRSHPKLRAVYIGHGTGLAPLQAKASQADFGGRFIFAYSCSPDQVARWLAAANLLALPSYAEGCPNVVIEALSCGRPVIASAVGGIPDLVNPSCGMLVPPQKIEELVTGIDAMLHRTWDEDEICRRFRRSWDQVAREVFAVCEELTARTHRQQWHEPETVVHNQ